MCKLICVTDRSLCADFETQLDRICEGGADAVILRAKELSEDEYEHLALRVKSICDKHGTKLILHTFADVAKKLGIKSIHLPLPVLSGLGKDVRESFTEIGASCHSREEAEQAVRLGAAYIVAGHIFETDCKRGLKGRGLEFLSEISKSVSVPVFAIGGITPEKVKSVLRSGASGVCVMSALMASPDPAGLIRGFGKEMSMNISPSQLKLYAITDRGCIGSRDLCKCVEDALAGGASIIQLRDKNVSHSELVAEAEALLPICRKYNAPLIVNDDWEAAVEAGADGVHVGIEDASVAEIRSKTGKQFIIGATAKTVEQARSAQQAGADYLGVGAVFPSPTKKNAIRITPDIFRSIAASVDIPCVAIGGISLDNIRSVLDIGADGYAVVSAVFGQDDIRLAAEDLKAAIGS